MRMRGPGFTRRHLQVGLGLLWLLDAGLQAQPFMFGPGFARDVIAPAGAGQPVGVSAPVHWAAGLLAGHPALFNTLFVVSQAALGLALLRRRSARLALAGTVVWGLAVWWLGEGLGGTTGGMSLLEGAPGPALLYAAAAVVAWPSRASAGTRAEGDEPARAAVAVPVWVALWIGGAVLGDSRAALVGVYVLVALWGLLGGAWRRLSAVMGAGIAIGAWVTVQSYGDLASGQATDPNSAPVIVLLALAVGFAARSGWRAARTAAATEGAGGAGAASGRRSLAA